MSDSEEFDAIVVGAGPAGIACAYTLAKAGKQVLVIERADTPGSKNVTGGRFYTYALEIVDEGLTAEAELERKVTHEQIMMLSGDNSVTIDYSNPAYNSSGSVPQSYTILRAKFDQWFAGKAEAMGAMIVCGVKVDSLIERDGKIVGVIAGEDEMLADVVIAADGVNSFLAQKAGLISDISSHNVGVGVKEVIELSPETIQQRFTLKPDEGVARMVLGCTEGIPGGGFLYTNRDSISLGAVFFPEAVAKHGKSIHTMFQEFKMHPAILPLLEGGSSVEYGGHLVCEAGHQGIPKKLYREGFLVVGEAAGFVINTGATIRGIDLAVLSGVAAARAVVGESNLAKQGPAYMSELETIKLLPSMKAVAGYHELLEIPRLFTNYPNLALDLFGKVFTVDGQLPRSMMREVPALLKQHDLSIWQMLKDAVTGAKAI